MLKNTNSTSNHHYVRTFFASIFGMLALSLILASILIVWLNRTLTDTDTYMEAVAPLVVKPEVQDFVAMKTSEAILKNNDPIDLASKLLPREQTVGMMPEQVGEQLKKTVNVNVSQVVASPAFVKLWVDTNRSAHSAFTQQIKSGSGELSLDLSPIIIGVTNELKATQLSPIADKIELKPENAKLDLKGGGIDKASNYYDSFQKGTLAIIVAAIIAIALAVFISVHHVKTLRRIVFGTGLIAVALTGLMYMPSLVKFNDTKDSVEQKAAVAIADTLFHDLRVACLVIAVICISLAVASKLYDLRRMPR